MLSNATRFYCIFSLFLLVSFVAQASPEPSFECNIGAHSALKRNGIDVGKFIYYGGDFVGLTGYPENASEKLTKVVSGSGEKYSDGVLTFHAKGDVGQLSIANGPTFNCISTASMVIADAVSLETIVRSAPSVNAARIDRLPLKEPVQLIGKSGEYYQDYQWYKIRYGEGQEGYAWGGTMCVETELSGILIGCSRYLQNTSVQPSPQSGGLTMYANGRSQFGSKVRNGPSPTATQIFSLPQGAPFQVVQETGNFFDGWQWIKIQTANGTGFVWGGTICTTDKQLIGVHFGCN